MGTDQSTQGKVLCFRGSETVRMALLVRALDLMFFPCKLIKVEQSVHSRFQQRLAVM